MKQKTTNFVLGDIACCCNVILVFVACFFAKNSAELPDCDAEESDFHNLELDINAWAN